MKKLFAMLLSLAIVLPLASCGSLPNSLDDLLNGESTSGGSVDNTGYAENGYAEGYLGDTMHTYWFDFVINSAYTCAEFDGLTAEDGYKFLVAEISITNTTKSTQPMYFYDFQIQWDVQEGEDEDEAYDFPLYDVKEDENGETDWVTMSDQQLPTYWDLGINEERTGILLYAVPSGAKSYSISFQEYFDSDNEDESTGDLFFIWFSAEER